MKRLYFVSLLGFMLIGQSQAHDLIPASLISAMPSSDMLKACVAGPAIGFAGGTAWTLCRAAHANYTYRAGNIFSDEQHSNSLINILKYGSQPNIDENLQFEPRYINNLGISWLRSIFLGATFGALYGIYKNGIKDGLKVAAGTFASAWLLNSALSTCICKPYYEPDLRTNLFLKGQ